MATQQEVEELEPVGRIGEPLGEVLADAVAPEPVRGGGTPAEAPPAQVPAGIPFERSPHEERTLQTPVETPSAADLEATLDRAGEGETHGEPVAPSPGRQQAEALPEEDESATA